MKIDTTLMPHTVGFVTLPGRTGEGLSFDSFCSLSAEAGGAGVKAAPVLSQNVFGFDALGVLGLGGPAGVGQRLIAPPEGRNAGIGVSVAAPWQEAMATPETGTQAANIYWSAPTVATPADTKREAVHGVLPLSVRPERAPVGGFAAPAMPIPAVEAPKGENVLRTGNAAFCAVRPFGATAAEEAPAPRKTATFRFAAEADPASGQISVTASEDGEHLHIAAAAPDLTDNDRQNLKTLAEEAAAEAGVTLGDLRLNGVVVRQFSRTR